MFYDDDFDALEAGTAYALMRHGQDRQTQELLHGLRGSAQDVHVDVHVHSEVEHPRPVNALDFNTTVTPTDWDGFVGQEPMKRQLDVRIRSALARNAALPHILFASGRPGVGKTHLARLVASMMGVRIWELVPPFNIFALVEATQQLGDRDILFIDEVHRLGHRGGEILLKVLEEKVAFLPTGEVIPLADFTVIGATTEPDALSEAVVDRFKFAPFFQAYSNVELARIVVRFSERHDCLDSVTTETAVAIALACRNTPRIAEEMVLAARDLDVALGQPPAPTELLKFLEVEPDGLTRTHIHYLTALRQYFAREDSDGNIEYVIGEAAIMQIMRETKPGIRRIEAFLVERGLIDRTPRGRRLTDLGIEQAEQFIAEGKGAADSR